MKSSSLRGERLLLTGHLVGSLGDVVAAYSFGLTLYPPSTETHDAESEVRIPAIVITHSAPS